MTKSSMLARAATLAAGLLGVGAPVHAADLSFAYVTSATTVGSFYMAGTGTITIDETSGVAGRYRVTAGNGTFLFGELLEDSSLRIFYSTALSGATAASYVVFDDDGTVTDYRFELFVNEFFVNSLTLAFNGGNPTAAAWPVTSPQPATVAVESFVPEPPIPPAVPEPATWAMMIAGFGAVGLALRCRGRRDVALA